MDMVQEAEQMEIALILGMLLIILQQEGDLEEYTQLIWEALQETFPLLQDGEETQAAQEQPMEEMAILII